MKIRRIQLQKSEIAKMPAQERDFLILAGHMQNEINSIHKIFAWCLHSRGSSIDSEVEALANGAQAMIYARILAGKLLEAWNALGDDWFKTKLSLQFEPKLHPIAGEALAKLKIYFNKKNLIYRIRNGYAFHYSASKVGAKWESAADSETFEIILGGSLGNNLYLGAELATNVAMLEDMNAINQEEGLRIFLDEVQSISFSFGDFLDGAIIAILEDLLNSKIGVLGHEEDIFPTRSYNQIKIPHFCLPDAQITPHPS
jgi:hypothetical protein